MSVLSFENKEIFPPEEKPFCVPGPGFTGGFSLCLANGQGWSILSTEGTRSLVERWASIMGINVNDLHQCSCKTAENKWELSFRATPAYAGGDPESSPAEGGIQTIPDSSSRLKSCRDKFSRNDGVNEFCRNHHGHPQMLFLPRQEDGQKWHQKKGWKVQNLERIKIWSHPSSAHIICEIGAEDHFDLDLIRMWAATYPIYQRAMETGGLPFHACLAGRGEMGVLLAAPGGGGKSTCARRLPPPWKVLCDDETLIVRDPEGRYFVHPFPTWSNFFWRREDRTWNVQGYIPLSAIFFIKKGKKDEVIPMGRGEASARMYQAAEQVCLRNWRYFSAEEERGEKERLFANACELSQKIPAFTLRVSLQGQFWKEIEKVLNTRKLYPHQNSSFPRSLSLHVLSRERESRKKLDFRQV